MKLTSAATSPPRITARKNTIWLDTASGSALNAAVVGAISGRRSQTPSRMASTTKSR